MSAASESERRRAAVIGKVRRALADDGNGDARRAAVEERLSRPRPNLVPARGQLTGEARLALFAEMAEKVSASVERVASAEELPEAVASYLRARNLPSELRMGADPRLKALPWDRASHLEIKHGPSDGRDLAAISHAFGGVAETGTLFLLSGQENPTSLNFLPEHHLVVLAAQDIAGDYEALWARLRAAEGDAGLPRTVNLVTGPSRSADIEQTLLLGAHGPRALHILLLGEG
ncbi:LutC/YkgG family protein [Afifella pfennigii]|uniref:LutC/YkgG family protein n=1 Tax=Afifella pfennigii TaxID=209897 RepID=UPI00054E3BDD|nr:lactate utilization protein [Afifella pfennigii]